MPKANNSLSFTKTLRVLKELASLVLSCFRDEQAIAWLKQDWLTCKQESSYHKQEKPTIQHRCSTDKHGYLTTDLLPLVFIF